MKYEEYEAIAKTLTPENSPEVVKQLLDGIKADTTAFESMVKTNEEMDKKIRDLQDTNIKLFLSQTGKADDGAKDEEALAEEEHKAVETEIDSLLKGE